MITDLNDSVLYVHNQTAIIYIIDVSDQILINGLLIQISIDQLSYVTPLHDTHSGYFCYNNPLSSKILLICPQRICLLIVPLGSSLCQDTPFSGSI